MPSRQCIACARPAMAGRSRCTEHATYGPRPVRRHDSTHTSLAKRVVSEATVCEICGLPPTPADPLEAGHIIPLSKGGQSVLSNYRAEHRSHNRAEGARLAAERFSPGI